MKSCLSLRYFWDKQNMGPHQVGGAARCMNGVLATWLTQFYFNSCKTCMLNKIMRKLISETKYLVLQRVLDKKYN